MFTIVNYQFTRLRYQLTMRYGIITSDYGKQWHGSGFVRIRSSLPYPDPNFFLGNTDPDPEPDPSIALE